MSALTPGQRLSAAGYSAHAACRMAQRNLDCKDVDYIMRYGRHYHRAGVIHIHLRRKDIPGDDRADLAVARLEGATVVADPAGGCIITVWRNRQDGLRHIRRKRRRSC